MADFGVITRQLEAAIVDGDDEAAAEAARQALEAGAPAMSLIKDAVQPAMDEVGRLYDAGDIFLPELIRAGDAGKAALDLIVPQLSAEDADSSQAGVVVIATMFGDNHDIGKNVVAALLVANGFKVVDAGINCSPRTLLETARKEGATIIAASTLITTSLPYQREIVQTLRDSGQREQFFVVVGGGPVTPEWARQIGADGYGRDGKDAVALCLQLARGEATPPLAEPIVVGALKR
jgi:methylmalonyl-CoA mutase cobalamin-binding domain/chain